LKLSKITWLLLGIGILTVMLASLGTTYGAQQEEQSRLDQELPLAQLRLANLSSDELFSQQSSLKRQLAGKISQLDNVTNRLSYLARNIPVTSIIFDIAEDCDVEITEISSSGYSSANLEGITCPTLSYTVNIKGHVLNINNFVFELVKEFSTIEVKSVKMEFIEAEPEGSLAGIDLVIYSYQGD